MTTPVTGRRTPASGGGAIPTTAQSVPAWRFFLTGLLIVSAVGVFAYTAIQRLRTDMESVAHSREVLAALASVDGELAKANSSRRGFRISRDSSFVLAFVAAGDRAVNQFERLQELTESNWLQRERVERLTLAGRRRLDRFHEFVDAVGQGERPLEPLPSDPTAREIRAILLELVSEENRLLADRSGRAEGKALAADVAIIGGFTLAFAMFFFAWRRSVRPARERHESSRLLAERALELDVANRQLEQLLFAASIRLQDPLHALEKIAAELAGSAQQSARAGQLPDAVNRMSRIVDDLRTYSRLVGYVAARDRVPLEAVVQRMLDTLETRIRASGASVTVGRLPAVVGDATLIEWLLFQLLDNALTFHAEGVAPNVSISATNLNDRVTVCIRDQGIGILRDNHARAFNLFERLDRHDYPGSGIGLPIAQRAAELMGTRVSVESAPSEGSAFCFKLSAALTSS